MKISFPTLTVAMLAGLGTGHALAANPASDVDRSFVAGVSQGGLFEVKLGSLAADQGYSQDIKDQGATEAHDHQLVGDKLKSIASDDGIAVADTLDEHFQHELAADRALSGTAFDAAYLRDMEAIHAKDGAAFAREAATGSDPRLRRFAAETHRIVARHVGELKALPAARD